MTTADQAAPAAPVPTPGPRLAWLWLGVAVAVLAVGWAVALAAKDDPEPYRPDDAEYDPPPQWERGPGYQQMP